MIDNYLLLGRWKVDYQQQFEVEYSINGLANPSLIGYMTSPAFEQFAVNVTAIPRPSVAVIDLTDETLTERLRSRERNCHGRRVSSNTWVTSD